MDSNSLQVNCKKSQLMVLSLLQHKPVVTVLVGGEVLVAESSIKVLGFVLDDKLLCHEQVAAAAKKANSGLYALTLAAKHGLSRNLLLKIANGLVFSHLHYCDTTLGQASKTVLERLHISKTKPSGQL